MGEPLGGGAEPPDSSCGSTDGSQDGVRRRRRPSVSPPDLSRQDGVVDRGCIATPSKSSDTGTNGKTRLSAFATPFTPPQQNTPQRSDVSDVRSERRGGAGGYGGGRVPPTACPPTTGIPLLPDSGFGGRQASAQDVLQVLALCHEFEEKQERRVTALEQQVLRAVEQRRQQQKLFEAQCAALGSAVATLARRVADWTVQQQQQQQQQQQLQQPQLPDDESSPAPRQLHSPCRASSIPQLPAPSSSGHSPAPDPFAFTGPAEDWAQFYGLGVFDRESIGSGSPQGDDLTCARLTQLLSTFQTGMPRHSPPHHLGGWTGLADDPRADPGHGFGGCSPDGLAGGCSPEGAGSSEDVLPVVDGGVED